MSDLTGRVCLITGANAGIGRVTAVELAKRGARMILAGRSLERTQSVLDEIRGAGHEVDFIPLDLGSLDSVRRCAESVLKRDEPIHVLINNAGLAGMRGLTEDGFELAFGVNHLGHFLLTKLLRDKLEASAPARIVNVASRAHFRTDRIDYSAVRQATASVTGMPEYQVSKLANVLFTVELARRIEGSGVTTYAVHPGVVASSIWRRIPWPFRSIAHLFMISNEEGAKTTIYCATDEGVASDNGLYYDTCRVKEPNPVVHDRAIAAELWDRSEAWVS